MSQFNQQASNSPITIRIKEKFQRFLSEQWIVQFALIGLLLLAYPMCQVLPVYFGWENGPIGVTEKSLLFIGMLLALIFARNVRNKDLSRFWIVIFSFWLILLVRKLGWGSLFFPSVTTGVHGLFSPHLKTLPYRLFIYSILAVITVYDLVIIFKHHLSRFIIKLWKNKKFPIFELAVATIAICITNFSEKHLFTIMGERNFIFDKYIECMVLFGLLTAQSSVFITLQQKEIGVLNRNLD